VLAIEREIRMLYPIVAYKLSPSLDFVDLLAEDPMDRKHGEAEIYNALIYKHTEPKEVQWGGTKWIIPYPGPEPINFVGFLDGRLSYADYLYTGESDLEPIISKRMLYVLRSVEEFSYKAISTRIYDYGFQNQGINEFLGLNIPPAGEFNEDYVCLQLLEHIDGIDPDSCEYEDYDDDAPVILPPRLKSSWRLKEPSDGFPPIFRVKKQSNTLFVSPVAKVALEEAGIKGLSFFPKEGTPLPNSRSFIALKPILRIRLENDPLPRQPVAYELCCPYRIDSPEEIVLYQPDRPEEPSWAADYQLDWRLNLDKLSEEEQELAYEQESELNAILREQECYDNNFRKISEQLHYNYPCETAYNGPDPINFLGNLQQIKSDILPNSENWTIVSLGVLETLCSIGKLNCRIIPVRIFDTSLEDKLEQYIHQIDWPHEICNQNYFALQVLEQLYAVDWARTELHEYDEERMEQGIDVTIDRHLFNIQKTVLKEPLGGFPPIFWVDTYTDKLISCAAKQALEKENFINLTFIPYEGTRS
jgi:hypothetical protein